MPEPRQAKQENSTMAHPELSRHPESTRHDPERNNSGKEESPFHNELFAEKTPLAYMRNPKHGERNTKELEELFKPIKIYDLPKEREKLSETGKMLFDGFVEHNGIKFKKALERLPDAEVRSELSKVTWLFNKGMGGGANCAIGVDDDNLHIFYLTHDGAGIEIYSRPYDPSTDKTMAADFNDAKARKASLNDVFIDPDKVENLSKMKPGEQELVAGIMARDGMRIRSALSHMQGGDVEDQLSRVASMINKHGPVVMIGADKDKLKITYASYPGEGQEIYSGPYPGKE
jgi:hypothetical protein